MSSLVTSCNVIGQYLPPCCRQPQCWLLIGQYLIILPRVLVAVDELLLLAPPEAEAEVPEATTPLPPPPPPLDPPPPPLPPPPPPEPLLLLFLLLFLLRSSRSLITEKGSRASLPSSNSKAKWDGPTAICLTSSLIEETAELPANEMSL